MERERETVARRATVRLRGVMGESFVVSSVAPLLSIHREAVLPPTRLRGVKGPPALTNILI
jgi:hypothetical protein